MRSAFLEALARELNGRSDVGDGELHKLAIAARQQVAPWAIEENNNACFIVRDKTGRALAYFYFEDEPGRRSAAIHRES